jgi:tetratricopeptide (TPR) repeat protein
MTTATLQAASNPTSRTASAPRLLQADTPARKALAIALSALDAAEQRGEPARLSMALSNVAHCYRILKMPSHRRWYLQQALRFANLLPAVDNSVDLLCELAEASLACGDEDFDPDGAEATDDADAERKAHNARDTARDCLFQAARLAAHSADPQWEVTVLMRASDLLDAMGDHDDAIAIQRRALALIGQGAVQVADRAG